MHQNVPTTKAKKELALAVTDGEAPYRNLARLVVERQIPDAKIIRAGYLLVAETAGVAAGEAFISELARELNPQSVTDEKEEEPVDAMERNFRPYTPSERSDVDILPKLEFTETKFLPDIMAVVATSKQFAFSDVFQDTSAGRDAIIMTLRQAEYQQLIQRLEIERDRLREDERAVYTSTELFKQHLESRPDWQRATHIRNIIYLLKSDPERRLVFLRKLTD